MEMYCSSVVRAAGDLAGVFEYVDDVGYFYLYNVLKDSGSKIVNAIWVLNEALDFSQDDVDVRWDSSEENVGLFLRGQLWAVYDCRSGKKYGGNYVPGAPTSVPQEIADSFGSQ